MQPSVDFCRVREAHHRALADVALLDNVRTVANTAANAWAKEGAAAEQRERRKRRTQDAASRLTLVGTVADDLRGLSENPDRGYADEV
jgi:hypothetical protein